MCKLAGISCAHLARHCCTASATWSPVQLLSGESCAALYASCRLHAAVPVVMVQQHGFMASQGGLMIALEADIWLQSRRAWLPRASLGWARPCCLCASSQRSKSRDATGERSKMMLHVSVVLLHVFPGQLWPKQALEFESARK
jgi:hypothetical protein